MTRINNVEQILVLIQAHLERLDKRKVGKEVKSRDAETRAPFDRVRALAATAGTSDADLSRALLAALLIQELGPALAGDVSFQNLVDRIDQTMRADEQSAALLAQSIKQLSAGGGK